MPPRHGKSELTGRYFPTWHLGTYPDKPLIYASYNDDRARKYGRWGRNLMEEFGPSVFGVQLSPDSRAADRWNLDGYEGGFLAAGVGGGITGEPADGLILDDLVKNSEQAVSEVYREKVWDWLMSSAFTRLSPQGWVIGIGTRWHRDDWIGRVQREQPGEWELVSLPALAEDGDLLGRKPGEALWPEKFNPKRLEKIRDSSHSPYWWLAQYQQQPSQHEHQKWPAEYFDGADLWFDTWPGRLQCRVIALDPSMGKNTTKGDFAAFVLLGVDHANDFWIEADLERRPAEKIVPDGVDLCMRFPPDAFGIEGNAWQHLLEPLFLNEFQRRGRIPADCYMLDNSINKQIRIERLGRYLKGRRCHFRRTAGTELLIAQLREFPVAKYDDGPDALEMAVRLGRDLLPEAFADDQFSPSQPDEPQYMAGHY